jgi:hypothetical protein
MKKIFVTYFILLASFYFIRMINNHSFRNLLELISLLLFNIQCSMYLYRSSENKKIIWAIFGFFGSITVVIIHWYIYHIRDRHKNGKSIFNKDILDYYSIQKILENKYNKN